MGFDWRYDCIPTSYLELPAGWAHFAQFTIAVVNKDAKKSKYSGALWHCRIICQDSFLRHLPQGKLLMTCGITWQIHCTGSARRSTIGAGRSSWRSARSSRASQSATPWSSRLRCRSSGAPSGSLAAPAVGTAPKMRGLTQTATMGETSGVMTLQKVFHFVGVVGLSLTRVHVSPHFHAQ
jgi:hypothetical protein